MVKVSATVAWPIMVRAQTRPARVGFLGLAPAQAWTQQFATLRAGLKHLGHVEGETYVIEFSFAETVEQMRDCAATLVTSNVDVILAPASTEVEATLLTTRKIPIVFVQHADPVGLGHVASFARPGGNVTGISIALREITVKAMEILVDLTDGADAISVLWNPTTPSHHEVLRSLRRAATERRVRLLLTPAGTVADLESAFASMSDENVYGFVVPPSPLTNTARRVIAKQEVVSQLPGIFVEKDNVAAGGLMSYGPNFNEMYRRSAIYIDRILRGAKPGDLPVTQSSRSELALNLQTAKILNLTIPPSIYARADDVIE
jgi:putative ABC transport system substrate-binding protein